MLRDDLRRNQMAKKEITASRKLQSGLIVFFSQSECVASLVFY